MSSPKTYAEGRADAFREAARCLRDYAAHHLTNREQRKVAAAHALQFEDLAEAAAGAPPAAPREPGPGVADMTELYRIAAAPRETPQRTGDGCCPYHADGGDWSIGCIPRQQRTGEQLDEARELLSLLTHLIRWWGAQEDGIPEEVAPTYDRAMAWLVRAAESAPPVTDQRAPGEARQHIAELLSILDSAEMAGTMQYAAAHGWNIAKDVSQRNGAALAEARAYLASDPSFFSSTPEALPREERAWRRLNELVIAINDFVHEQVHGEGHSAYLRMMELCNKATGYLATTPPEAQRSADGVGSVADWIDMGSGVLLHASGATVAIGAHEYVGQWAAYRDAALETRSWHATRAEAMAAALLFAVKTGGGKRRAIRYFWERSSQRSDVGFNTAELAAADALHFDAAERARSAAARKGGG